MFSLISSLGFNPSCILCQQKLMGFDRICQGCLSDLPWVTSGCRQCATPLSQDQQSCGACQQKPPMFDHAVVALDYCFPVDRLIVGAKFSGRLSHLSLLAELFCDYWQQHNIARPEILIPVPLHAKRLKERGYNQAVELARVIGRKLSIEVDFSLVTREKPTLAQTHLNADERRKNVQQAFQCKSLLSQQKIALVDDVLTTGSTLNALAKTLRARGAQHIQVYCMARSLGR